MRASYGVTGQQDGIGNYNYLPIYTISQSGAGSLIGGTPTPTYRPKAYVPNLKWETTTSWNVGFDFGFLKDRITGSFDYYTRQTKDLIATVPAAAGTTFDRNITTNVGNVDSQGVEFSLNATPHTDQGLELGFEFQHDMAEDESEKLITDSRYACHQYFRRSIYRQLSGTDIERGICSLYVLRLPPTV